MKNDNRKIFLPLILIFIVLNALIIVFRNSWEEKGLDIDFVLIANLLLFIISLAGFFFQRKGIQSANPNAFVRSVYSAILIKLFVCMIAVTVYAFVKTKNVNKPALFVSMALYAVYTSVEVGGLMKLARKKNNV